MCVHITNQPHPPYTAPYLSLLQTLSLLATPPAYSQIPQVLEGAHTVHERLRAISLCAMSRGISGARSHMGQSGASPCKQKKACRDVYALRVVHQRATHHVRERERERERERGSCCRFCSRQRRGQVLTNLLPLYLMKNIAALLVY
jgi:hypothetical protein